MLIMNYLCGKKWMQKELLSLEHSTPDQGTEESVKIKQYCGLEPQQRKTPKVLNYYPPKSHICW